MNTVSNLSNSYKIEFSVPSKQEQLFKYIQLGTSKYPPYMNLLQIYSVSVADETVGERIREFVISRKWNQFGVQFLGTEPIHSFKPYLGNSISCIQIESKYAKHIINDLYRLGKISIDNKIIGNTLIEELEKNTSFAEKQNKDQLSKAQKTTLNYFVTLYIEDVISVIPNFESAIELLRSVVNFLVSRRDYRTINVEGFKKNFHRVAELDDSVADWILSLGRIMASRAEMETTYQTLSKDKKTASCLEINEYIEHCIKKAYLKMTCSVDLQAQ
ncbi:MAG: hypothetical protein VX777_10685 [Chlamydiota bacterium]|nr:hypothetical protein [Chlamydiota bacterium]